MLEAAVPAGRHVVHLWYLPGRLVIAAWLALAVLACWWRGRPAPVTA